jgi:putative MFS transporter
MEQAFQNRKAIPARIDRLPLSRELATILLLAGLAWLIESYDIGIVGNILPLLEQQYHLTTLYIAVLAVASTLGIVVAIIPAGWLADAIGRKKVLMMGTAWYALFSLLCGFSPDVPTLIVIRFISGFGMGAVFPIPYAMATELMPTNRRGAAVGVLDSFLSFGYFLAPFIAFTIVPLPSTKCT